ncbi:hypothetical protein D3C87_2047430 [compost metagenome]
MNIINFIMVDVVLYLLQECLRSRQFARQFVHSIDKLICLKEQPVGILQYLAPAGQ